MQPRSWIAAALCLATLALAGCHREQSDWEKARATNTVQSYDQYLAKYPNGSFATQAQARLAQVVEDQDWQKASAANTPEAYQAFLRQHPQGKWAEEARIRIENFALASPPNAPPPGAGTRSTPAAAAGAAAVGAAATAAARPIAAAPSTAATASRPTSAPSAANASTEPRRVPRTVSHRVATRPHGVARRGRAATDYGVQLGAFRSGEHAALRHWHALVARDSRLLRGLRPRVSRVGTKAGRLYRLQVHGLSAARAALICRRLRAHAQPCIVLRPSGR